MATETISLTGVLLAGGKSRRMGRDKRFLELNGRTLLDRAVSVFESLFEEVLIVVAEPTPELGGLRHRVVTDLIPGRAALGGLHAGLSYAAWPKVFAAACDMPFLSQPVIRRMVELAPHADAVIAQLADGLQPMHAVYSKGCLPYLERMARSGHLKLQDLCREPGLSVRLVSEEDLRGVDPQFLSFMNINTPADLEFARKLLAGGPLRREPGD